MFALRGRYWCKESTPPAEKQKHNAFEFNDLRAFCYLGKEDYIETIKTRIRAEYKAKGVLQNGEVERQTTKVL